MESDRIVQTRGTSGEGPNMYIDTARISGNAEEILGHLIPRRRDPLFPYHRRGYVGCATDSARLPQALAYGRKLATHLGPRYGPVS